MRRSNRAQKLTLAAGAMAAGMAGCNDGPTICDPAPPPLCDRLNRESPLRVTAEKDTVLFGEMTTFQCAVTDTVVTSIENVSVSPETGAISNVILQPPRSFSFSWGPKQGDGTFVAGQARIAVEANVRGTLDGKTDDCWITGEIGVRVNADGSAVILSLPEPDQALAMHFDLRVEASAEAGAVLLKAIPTLRPEESQRAVYRWRTSAGTLDPAGDHARFVPAEDGGSAVVQAEAVLDGSSLAVGVWEWRRP